MLWHRCFPMNFAKFLRAPFLTERLRWLLLKERSDFQTKGFKERERERERERDLKSTPADRSSITIFYINAIKLKISMFRVVSTYASLVYPSCRCFFKIMNFSDRFRQCFKFFFTALRSSCYEFSGISKKILKKNSMMKSRFINVAKGRI